MYSDWVTNCVIVFATVALVLACVGIHYEGLNLLARRLAHRQGAHRRRVLYAVLGAVVLHVAEIWIFGLGLWALLQMPESGHLVGAVESELLDSIYLSAATYSTVGFGDIAPVGSIRFLIGTEALVGFVLVTWTASFTFLEMGRYWRDR